MSCMPSKSSFSSFFPQFLISLFSCLFLENHFDFKKIDLYWTKCFWNHILQIPRGEYKKKKGNNRKMFIHRFLDSGREKCQLPTLVKNYGYPFVGIALIYNKCCHAFWGWEVNYLCPWQLTGRANKIPTLTIRLFLLYVRK